MLQDNEDRPINCLRVGGEGGIQTLIDPHGSAQIGTDIPVKGPYRVLAERRSRLQNVSMTGVDAKSRVDGMDETERRNRLWLKHLDQKSRVITTLETGLAPSSNPCLPATFARLRLTAWRLSSVWLWYPLL